MSTHAKAAAKFLADRERAAWHDRALYHVREKRDRMAHAVPEWEALRQAASENQAAHAGRIWDAISKSSNAMRRPTEWSSTGLPTPAR